MAKITTVILRCGLNGCGDRVGQVKTNGTTTQVLRYQKIGEIPVLAPRYMPAGGDAKLLRQTDDGYVVPRRRSVAARGEPIRRHQLRHVPESAIGDHLPNGAGGD
jgi:hypothetical protein